MKRGRKFIDALSTNVRPTLIPAPSAIVSYTNTLEGILARLGMEDAPLVGFKS